MTDTSTMTEQERQRFYLTDPESYNVQPGDTVYTAHQGANGTFLKLYIVRCDEERGPRIVNITWQAAHAMGIKPRDRRGEWTIHNPVYGMDRGFDIVYRLSASLFRDMSPRTVWADSPYNSNDPGYLLRHQWL